MADGSEEGTCTSSSYGRRGDSESGEGSKPVCRYGRTCYRKNPQHFEEFEHPWLGTGPYLSLYRVHPLISMTTEEDKSPASKKQKLDDSTGSGGSRCSPVTLSPESPDAPFTLSPHSLYYLTRVRGVESSYNAPHMAVGIKGRYIHV